MVSFRFGPRWLRWALPLAFVASAACATEIYRWTDANGQVHFGDKQNAPASGKKVDVKAPTPTQATAAPTNEIAKGQPSGNVERSRFGAPPLPDPDKKSTPADPSLVRPGCQDLIDQIARVKPGTNWESLSSKFDATCPGIAYECTVYRSTPGSNKCEWVKRTGSNILNTKSYP